jgi:hypothetical protein
VRALLVLVLTASVAFAETPMEARSIMRDYLDGEKVGGYVLVGMGVAGITTGTLFRTAHCPVRRGMSYPLITAGALHVIAGVYIGMASDKRIDDFGTEIARDGQAWTLRERERMDGVTSQLTVLKLVEVGLIAGGAGLAYWAYKKGRPKLEGVGAGIAIEAAATLVFDLWASHRANDYKDRVDKLQIVTPRLTLTF